MSQIEELDRAHDYQARRGATCPAGDQDVPLDPTSGLPRDYQAELRRVIGKDVQGRPAGWNAHEGRGPDEALRRSPTPSARGRRLAKAELLDGREEGPATRGGGAAGTKDETRPQRKAS
jgi:hypothetical protein